MTGKPMLSNYAPSAQFFQKILVNAAEERNTQRNMTDIRLQDCQLEIL